MKLTQYLGFFLKLMKEFFYLLYLFGGVLSSHPGT